MLTDAERADRLMGAIHAAIVGDAIDGLLAPGVPRLTMSPLAVRGGLACVEWTASAVPPGARPVVVHGVTVAEFVDTEIVAIRHYWDVVALLDGRAPRIGPAGRPG